MEAEFKSTQWFVPPLVGIFLKVAKISDSFQPFQHVCLTVLMFVCVP